MILAKILKSKSGKRIKVDLQLLKKKKIPLSKAKGYVFFN